MTMPPSGPWPPPPQGPPQYWGPPLPPPKDGGKAKWVLGGVGVLVVVVVTVVATLMLTRNSSHGSARPSGPPEATTPPTAADLASADDRGPISIVTEDPTCAAWGPINDTLTEQLAKGWSNRDPSVPSTSWTQQQEEQYQQAAKAMGSAADQTVPLVSKTPHRVMRELYAQTIAYLRAYAAATPNYVPSDDHLANVSTASSNALVWICSAISTGSAASRSQLIPATSAPVEIAPIGNPIQPSRFMTKASPVCPDWERTASEFDAVSSDWLASNPNIPVSQWSAEQQAIYAAIAAPMSANADQLQEMGIRSQNAVFADFADLAALYSRAYVQSFATYVPADAYLANASAQLVAVNNQACLAAEN